MIHYAFTFIYGLALLASFAGWGSLTANAAGRSSAGWSLRAAWGMCLCIVIGGILNLFGLAHRGVLLAMVAVGILFLLSFRKTRSERDANQKRFLIPTCVVILIGLRYSAAVSSDFYNAQDDYQGYFVFPEKIVQTGELGTDPFSERRIISSLGGQYFLDAMLIAWTGEAHLNLLDRGIGLLLLAGLVWSLARENGIPAQMAACAVLPIALSELPQVNVSSLLIACAICVALYRTLELARRGPNGIWRDGLLVGLVTAGAITLKMNVIPAVGLLAALHFLGRWVLDRRGRTQTLFCAAVAAGAAVLFLLPWMIASLRSSGTLLYPLLGQGYYGSNFGDYKLPNSGMNLGSIYHYIGTAFVGLPSILILISAAFAIGQRQVLRSEYLFRVAALIANIVVAISIGGFSTERFTFAFNFAAILVLLTYWLARPSTVVVAMLAIGLLVGDSWRPMRDNLRADLASLLSQIHGQTAADDWEPKRYLAAQESVPPHETILARLDHPFLLDFQRNQIDIIDVPGHASPPPGMPSFAGPGPLADYLLKRGIRYIAYSYADEAGFSRAAMGSRLEPTELEWFRNTTQYVFDFQDNLRELGRTHRRIYDDGQIWVIDLGAGS